MSKLNRGYVAIGLHNPKSAVNVGAALRAAFCFDADLMLVAGRRIKGLTSTPTDTYRAWKHIPTICVDDLFDAHPLGSIPIAVEFMADCQSLVDFVHPERAFYIFGPEDSSLGHKVFERCAHTIYIPTARCMNLAATVNVVLYDRLAKQK